MLRKILWVATAAAMMFMVSCGAREEPKAKAKPDAPRAAVAPVAVAPQLPMLFDFENDDDMKAWGVEDDIKDKVALAASAEHATSGKRSLRMELRPHEWPGMNTSRLPKDWSGYAELAFDVWAAADTSLCIRIDDEASKDYASRFNSQAQDVAKGANTITIPLVDVGDAIDLRRVRALYLFSTDVPENRAFFIDNVRLVRKR